MRKNKIMSVVLAMIMVFAFAPQTLVMPAFAKDNVQDHTAAQHAEKGFEAWTDATSLPADASMALENTSLESR